MSFWNKSFKGILGFWFVHTLLLGEGSKLHNIMCFWNIMKDFVLFPSFYPSINEGYWQLPIINYE